MKSNDLTEAEIMKALEDQKGVFLANGVFVRDALDLLNRKNAETDRLTVIEEVHRKQNGELRKEVKEKSKKLREILPIVAELKAEAIKEFTERVKTDFEDSRYITVNDSYRKTCNSVVDHCTKRIDQIAKEMGCDKEVTKKQTKQKTEQEEK